MLPATCPAAKQKSAAEEWQALAQRMGSAYASALSSDGADVQLNDSLQPGLKHLPQHWTPVSADQPSSFPQRVVIYDAAQCEHCPPACRPCKASCLCMYSATHYCTACAGIGVFGKQIVT